VILSLHAFNQFGYDDERSYASIFVMLVHLNVLLMHVTMAGLQPLQPSIT